MDNQDDIRDTEWKWNRSDGPVDVSLLPYLYAANVRDGKVTALTTGVGLSNLLGYSSVELESNASLWSDITHPDDAPRISAAIARLLEGSPLFEEYRVFREDGQLQWVRHAASPVKNETGAVIGIVGMLVEGEEFEAPSERMPHFKDHSVLHQFVEHMPAAVAMLDMDMRYLVVSRRWLADYRLADQDIIGKSHYEVFPRIPEQWKRIHQEVLAGQIMSSDEDVFTRINGTEEWVRWELRPWYIDGHHIGGLMMYTEVITERKRAEQALRESQELLATILDSLLSQVAVVDHSGYIITVNESWKQASVEGGDPTLERTGVGVNYVDVCHRSAEAGCVEAQVALDGLMGVLSGASTEFEMEYECTAPGQKRRWFVMRAAPLRGKEGGAVVTHLNSTRRRLAEEALRAGEERYRTVIEGVDAVVFRMRADHSLMMLGGDTHKLLGMTKDEYLADPEKWYNKVHYADRDLLNQALQDIRESRHSGSVEFRVVKASKDIRWLRAHLSPRYDEEGEFIYYDGVDVDVTELVEARLREARHSARVAALAEISRATAGSMDQDAIIDMTVRLAGQALRCVCGVLCTDPATKRLRVAYLAAGEGVLSEHSLTVLEELTDTLLERIEPESVREILQVLPAEMEQEARAWLGPSRSALLYADDSVYGLIACARPQGADEFEDDDQWFLAEVASDLSRAITTSRLYRRQARIAETLQRSLIPVVEEVPDLDIATCYVPAAGEAEIGGDFFDILDLGDGRVGVVVGDVSGKGMQAAIHTAEAKYMLRAFASLDPEPDVVIRQLNKALWNYIGEFSFVTLFYGIIDTRQHAMTYVNAGHELPLIYCTDENRVQEMEVSGPALGIVRDWEYQSSHAVLEADDLLICYTDGITDVPGDTERFGYERLVDTVASAHTEMPEQLLEHVIDVVRKFGHARQPDDQVLLVARPKHADT